MEEFRSLDEFYSYLETIESDFFSLIMMKQELNTVADYFKSFGDAESAIKIEWESDALSLSLSDGDLVPFCSLYDGEGKLLNYPDIQRFDEKEFQYFQTRVEATSNILLQSRYAHILWKSPLRHGKFARIAIIGYIALSHIFEGKERDNPQNLLGLSIIQSIKAAYNLAATSNQCIPEVKEEIRRLILTYNENCPSNFMIRYELIELASIKRRHFQNQELIDFVPICRHLAELQKSMGNFDFSIKFLKLGERIENRLGRSEYDWCNKIAELYEIQMNNRIKDEGFMVASHFCLQSIKQYKKCGNSEKVKELSVIYESIKNKEPFKKVSVEIDLSEHIQFCEKFVEEILVNTPEDIIQFIAQDDEYFIPKVDLVSARAQQLAKDFPLRRLIPSTHFDLEANPSRTFSTDEEKDQEIFLEQYKLEFECRNRVLIKKIFHEGISRNIITSKNVLDYLGQHSWLGHDFFRILPDEQKIKYSWLDLLKPSLDDYFFQYSTNISNPKHELNLVLCLDSLSIKIEGILRHFIALTDTPVTSHKKEDKTQLKMIEELLREESLEKYFSPNEIAFFKFIFSKDGYDIRNLIAHTILIPQHYTSDMMNYVILVLLKLGQYNLTEKTENELRP